MPSYHNKAPSGVYITLDSCDDDNADCYAFWVIEEIHRTDNIVMVAERSVPGLAQKELCVVKRTGVISGKMFKNSNGEVELNVYLRQLSRVKHDNLTKFYGFGKSSSGPDNFKLDLISEYCPGVLYFILPSFYEAAKALCFGKYVSVISYVIQKQKRGGTLSGGDLEDHLSRRSAPLPVVHVLAYSKQILEGLCYLHNLTKLVADEEAEAKAKTNNIIHCDIKPKNLFLSDYVHGVGYITIKIGDFDDPVRMMQDSTMAGDVKEIRGTMLYISPEMCKAGNKAAIVGRKTDTWSAGCVFLRMCLGKTEMCFKGEGTLRTESEFPNLLDYLHFIAAGATPCIPDDVDGEIRSMIQACLMYNEQDRPYASGVLKMFNPRLTSALIALRSAPPTEVQFKLDRPYKFDCSSLKVPDNYWYDNIIMLQSKLIKYDCEWLYAAHKLQRVGFDGLITVVCKAAWFSTLPYFRHSIMRLDFRGIENYSLNHNQLFPETVFSNLYSIQTDDCCEITKQDLESLFAAAPALSELLMNGSKLMPWCTSTLTGVPKSFRHVEWRHPRASGYQPEDMQTLFDMDMSDEFAPFRSFFQNNQTLVEDKDEYDVPPQLFVVYGQSTYVRPTKDPRLLRPNFLSLLGKGLIFDGGRPTLRPEIVRSSECSCPLTHKSCVLTECVKDHAYFTVVVTNEVRPEDWSAFWKEVELQHCGSGFPRPCVKLKLENCSWQQPLNGGGLVVVELTISKSAKISSEAWSNWSFRDVRQLIFRNCNKVSLRNENIPRTFPSLRSIVMDNSYFGAIDQNVFNEIPNLIHLCLDGTAMLEAICSSETDSVPIDSNVKTHLARLHFGDQFIWLREFLKKKPHLVEHKALGSIYEIAGDLMSSVYHRSENFLQLDKEYITTGHLQLKSSNRKFQLLEQRVENNKIIKQK